MSDMIKMIQMSKESCQTSILKKFRKDVKEWII